MAIGRLERVPLRDLWRHEEHGFSAWLAQNIEPLAEVLGISLTEPQREVTAGSFSVDLVAEDSESNRVVIENQLEATDHDHLGKLLTYLTNLEAKKAIWIARETRAEHVRAVSWLNEITPDDVEFFLVKLAAYRIGSSDPAPLFTVIVGPSQETKGFGQQKKELAERHLVRLRFWEGLLARAKEQGFMLHAGRSPVKEAWIGTGAGRTGLSFNYVIWMKDEAGVELYIDTGDPEENKLIFDGLAAKRLEIESEFGGGLEWERLDERKASRVRHTIRLGGLASGEDRWPAIWNSMIDAMRRLSEALRPFLE